MCGSRVPGVWTPLAAVRPKARSRTSRAGLAWRLLYRRHLPRALLEDLLRALLLLGALLVRALLLEALLQARPAWRLRYRRHLLRALVECSVVCEPKRHRQWQKNGFCRARPAWRLRYRRHLPRALVECSVVR